MQSKSPACFLVNFPRFDDVCSNELVRACSRSVLLPETLIGIRQQYWTELSIGWQAKFSGLRIGVKNPLQNGFGSIDRSMTPFHVDFSPNRLKEWPRSSVL